MKRKLLNSVLIVVIIMNAVLSLCGCSAESKQNKEYLSLLKAGDQALSDGNFEDALSAYQQAIELDPTVPQAYHRMFDTYVRDERFDDALKFALDNYQSISTEMTEQSDVPYKEEGSLYADMTPRQETALFFANAMDLGLHREEVLNNTYPQKRMAEYFTYVNDTQEAINDEKLTAACADVMDISTKYADLVKRMQEAGVLVSADMNGMSKQELLEIGLGYPTTDTMEDANIGPANLITPETAASFEKELRALLAEDPDLIFLYLDIANLYIEAGNREQAELVYREAIQALRDMADRRGYISASVESLFEARFANIYYMGFVASAGLIGKVNGYFTFYKPESESEQAKSTEQYQEDLNAANTEKDSLPLTEAESRFIQGKFNAYYRDLDECIGAVKDAKVSEENPNTPATEVEGDADLLVSAERCFKSDTFYPESGWMHLYTDTIESEKAGYYRGASYLMNINTGAIVYGADGDDPIACEDAIIGFKWMEPGTDTIIGIDSIIYEQRAGDLYAFTYDLQGRQVSEEKIYEAAEGSKDGIWDEVESAMEEAASGHTRSSGISADEKTGHLEGNDLVFEVSGVRFVKDASFNAIGASELSRCYVFDDIVVLYWMHFYDLVTEVYKLR